jgi:RNA-directed DNA polymerase
VWHCRFDWDSIKPELIHDLSTYRFTFQPLQKVTKSSGEVIHLWTSIDSLVLKQLSLVLNFHVLSSKLCTHLKWHGGSKQMVTSIQGENDVLNQVDYLRI